jgi:hypothetical protein
LGVTTTIPAKVGNPYVVDRTRHGLVRLSRESSNGYSNYIVFTHAEAIKVADALVDFVETGMAEGPPRRRVYTTETP